MRVVPVPMLSDNFAYLLIDSQGTTAAVDPVEPEKILQAAEREGVKVTTILTTHHHWDHAGGNEKFAELAPGITVIGGVNDKVAACTQTVKDDEHITIGQIKIQCIETPFHTQGHICYFCEESGSGDKIVFTGDTLFIAGCGRCFVGTPEQMYSALVGKLSKLPKDTQVYCGHEYTLSNLKFAIKADGANQAVKDKLDWAQRQRDAGHATIPSTIGEELATNPFFRCEDPAVAACPMSSASFRAFRLWGDALACNTDPMLQEELQYNPFLRCKEPALQKFTGKTDPVDVIGQTRKLKDQG
ncbi:hypothetical protein WJX73_007364 [Symbiochloris irregularis]|uniref:hydroxyacylglutathione hydrolase n=1 Tax=Symbiochloris irregularis TaxID=706552 RepID=A0AAW1PRF3_9CHLO